jgi:hypothetical protein
MMASPTSLLRGRAPRSFELSWTAFPGVHSMQVATGDNGVCPRIWCQLNDDQRHSESAATPGLFEIRPNEGSRLQTWFRGNIAVRTIRGISGVNKAALI